MNRGTPLIIPTVKIPACIAAVALVYLAAVAQWETPLQAHTDGAHPNTAPVTTAALSTVWQTQTVDCPGYYVDYTSIALDSAGRPHIAYSDNAVGHVIYARWTGTAWVT